MDNKTKKAIAIIGCGIVGGGTAKLLTEDIDYLKKRTNINFYLKYILSKTFKNAEKLGFDKKLFVNDIETILKDPEVEVVAELVGGTTVAYEYAKQILKAGKNLVTANKALIACKGEELFALARKNNVVIACEASCAGGIPIIRALYDGLIANRNEALYGIVNGTCNFILTEMNEKGSSYEEALKGAQEKGLAEADPTLDVSGADSAHKLAILSSLAFGLNVKLDFIPVTGIDTLDIFDINLGKELGYTVKLIAKAEMIGGKLSLRVAPSFIQKDHPLARISGSFNAVSVYSHAVGHTMYYGRGAGSSPTASAVTADIIGILTGTAKNAFDLPIWPDVTPNPEYLPTDQVTGRYYMRINVKDEPGVLAEISATFAKHNISILSVFQNGTGENNVPIVIVTHEAKMGDIKTAIEIIDNFSFISGKSVYLPIIDEHKETL